MITRDIENKVILLSKSFPVVAITGARQTGKTTFLKDFFKEYQYYNLETPSTLAMVESDPKAFIHNQHHIIIDEVQKFPQLLSYIQEVVDERKEMADFIISGSENILLSEKISQSLAGRVWYLTLYPLSFAELRRENMLHTDFAEQIFQWCMPALYDRDIPASLYYDQYLATYVERDVRNIATIQNLTLFRKFLSLLAWRIGQLTNLSSLANDVGVDAKTIERWISILEASYLIFQLQPYYKNYGKRVIKSSKIYFTDTGLVCRLLWVHSPQELRNHYLIWNLFENMVIGDIIKEINNNHTTEQVYFFRDSNHNEVDLIIDTTSYQIPIEIKSSSTFNQKFLNWIRYRQKNTQDDTHKKVDNGFIVYSGETIDYGYDKILHWTESSRVLKWK